MTVSSTTTKNSYSGDGSTTVFAYTFKIFAQSDVIVILRTDSDGTEAVQTISTDYTVSNVGNANGGNITFTTAPATGKTVVLLRSTSQTQNTDYTPNDPFPAETHEEALDKLTFITQELEEELGRSIKLSRTNTMTSTEFRVGSTDRANKIFAFDSSGELAVTQEIGTFRGDWAASTAYDERDIVKDGSNDNIYIVNTSHTSSGTTPLSSNANSSYYDLIVDAEAAATSATNAATSATNAATSATNASTSATAAAASATAAASSETNAATSETNAENAKTDAVAAKDAALNAQSAAETAKTAAQTAKTGAETAKTGAETAKAAAETAQTAAATSATNAATSETNASTSATTATTKASEAATSATNAATSATSASTAQTAAETAQTAAEAAQAAAELAADNFDDTYLGAKASDPTVDNDGDALTAGDLYFNTTTNNLKVYTGSAWQDAAVDESSFVAVTGDDVTGNINFADNAKAQFGASNDLQIYHDGNHSYVVDNGTGGLQLRGSSFVALQGTNGENGVLVTENGSAQLRFNNSPKLETSGTGVTITGTATATSFSGDGSNLTNLPETGDGGIAMAIALG